jgi:large subunit ribosomal protein L18
MSGQRNKQERRRVRRYRIRKRIQGTMERPRLSVFRSSLHIYAQVIDDQGGQTLAAASSREIKAASSGRIGVSSEVGKLIAQRAKDKGVTRVAFDRGGYQFHGRVKALADGARSGGLDF